MAVCAVTVAGRPVHVEEWATAEEILRQAGIAHPEERGLVEQRHEGEPGEVVPRQVPLHLQGGEAFEDLPVGQYG